MPRVTYGARTAEAAVDISTGNLSLVVVVGTIALAALAILMVVLTLKPGGLFAQAAARRV